MSNISEQLVGKKILVVDDEQFLREAIIFDLKRRGGTIFEAANGLEAIKIVEKEKPDIVLSDIRMPHCTGIELLEKIRKINLLTPIVFLVTGFSDLTEAEALKRGANALLVKPIDRIKMLDLISQFANAKPASTK